MGIIPRFATFFVYFDWAIQINIFYFSIFNYCSKTNKTPNLFALMGMGMIAGASGAIIGTPAEVALIRMTADGRLPMAERRNYTGVFNALFRMTSEEGTIKKKRLIKFS